MALCQARAQAINIRYRTPTIAIISVGEFFRSSGYSLR